MTVERFALLLSLLLLLWSLRREQKVDSPPPAPSTCERFYCSCPKVEGCEYSLKLCQRYIDSLPSWAPLDDGGSEMRPGVLFVLPARPLDGRERR